MSLGNLAVKYLLSSTMFSTVLPAINSVEEVLENCARVRGRFQDLLGDNDYWITPWKGGELTIARKVR